MASKPNTRNWNAWVDLQPPGPGRLHVTGEVEVSATNKNPVLNKHQPQGINPEILLLDLAIVEQGLGNQVFAWREARYEETPVNKGQYSQVDILWEGNVVTSITKIGETH